MIFSTMIARWIFIVLVLTAAVQSIYFYPSLPETLASHFNGSGLPNGWLSKPAFFAVYGLVIVSSLVIFMIAPQRSVHRRSMPQKSFAMTDVGKSMLVFGSAHMSTLR